MLVYEKYHGVNLSPQGKALSLQVIRKHRLWEFFLIEKLKFNWEEVHEVAEQLEHIQSSLLMKRLDNFLGNPQYDPYGNPIPNVKGGFTAKHKVLLTNMLERESGIVTAVKDSNTAFLQYLNKRGIYLGAKINITEKILFDNSMDISIDNHPKINVSQKVSDHIFIVK